MSSPTLSDIQAKVRQLTASQTSNQLSDTEINAFINSFYQNDLPAEFRSLKLRDTYTFNTERGIGVYAFDSVNFTTLEAPARIAKRNVYFTNDLSTFNGYNVWYNQQYIEQMATGDGTTGPYAYTTTNNPVLRSSNNDPTLLSYPSGRVQNILITAYDSADTYNVTDDGNGNLIGDATAGTIDYSTGAVTGLVFSANIPSGNPINIEYFPVTYNQPTSILFYQNQLTLFPIPDQGYTVEIEAYRTPTQVLLNTPANAGVPELNEWWELIAAGASKKFYENRLDDDGIAFMDKMLQEKYAIAEARTYAELGSQQVQTIYSGQLNGLGGQSFGGYFGV